MSAPEILEATARQQLQMLRELTNLTGALHEAQVIQLKMWPLVLFKIKPGLEVAWDITTKVVAYVLTSKGKRESKKTLETRVKVLNKWVQELLGPEWMVVVEFTGKTPDRIYGSRDFSAATAGNSGPLAGAKRSPAI